MERDRNSFDTKCYVCNCKVPAGSGRVYINNATYDRRRGQGRPIDHRVKCEVCHRGNYTTLLERNKGELGTWDAQGVNGWHLAVEDAAFIGRYVWPNDSQRQIVHSNEPIPEGWNLICKFTGIFAHHGGESQLVAGPSLSPYVADPASEPWEPWCCQLDDTVVLGKVMTKRAVTRLEKRLAPMIEAHNS